MHATSRPSVAKPKFPLLSVVLAALLGAGLEIAVAIWTGARESWDTPEFVVIVLPGLALITVLFAWIHPRRSVICGVAAVVGQFLAMLLRADEVGSLWPMGLLIAVLLMAAVALLGLFIGRLRREAARDVDVHPGDPEDVEDQ